jgi:purine-binding chemotaxis protein CheW
MNLRGTVVTVIDLAQRLGLGGKDVGDRCIMLMNRGSRPVGMVVDAVRDVIVVDEDMMESAREGGAQSLSELATGVVRLEAGPVVLLDMRRLMAEVLR